jgi:dipeptidase E
VKRLFLASYFAKVADMLPEFLEEGLRGKKVAFIPTAAVPEKVRFFVDADREALEKLGLEVDALEISTAPARTIARKLEESDLVFASGGNSFFLLQELVRTKAGEAILEGIRSGKPYVGSSAGSIVLAPDIRYVEKMDSPKKAPELGGSAGLGAGGFYPLPHFGNSPFKKVDERIIADYGEKIELVPIGNDQVIAVKGRSRRILTNRG